VILAAVPSSETDDVEGDLRRNGVVEGSTFVVEELGGVHKESKVGSGVDQARCVGIHILDGVVELCFDSRLLRERVLVEDELAVGKVPFATDLLREDGLENLLEWICSKMAMRWMLHVLLHVDGGLVDEHAVGLLEEAKWWMLQLRVQLRVDGGLVDDHVVLLWVQEVEMATAMLLLYVVDLLLLADGGLVLVDDLEAAAVDGASGVHVGVCACQGRVDC
jgi:hypothetical protein